MLKKVGDGILSVESAPVLLFCACSGVEAFPCDGEAPDEQMDAAYDSVWSPPYRACLPDQEDETTDCFIDLGFNTSNILDRDSVGSSLEDTSQESSVALRRLFNLCCVEDIWRYLHPSVSGFTWARWDHSCASRIDLFGVPYAWVPHVVSCDILACPFSDHCGVLMSLSVPDAVPLGPGLWKLIFSVLDDDDYFSLIADFLSLWRQRMSLFPSLVKWWDEGKSRIKGLTINYCCRRSAAKKLERDLLSRLANRLKSKIDSGFVSGIGPCRCAVSFEGA